VTSRSRILALAPLAVALVAVAPVAGCSSTEALSPAPLPSVSLASGDYALRFTPHELDLALVRGDETILDFPADAFELGTVPALDDRVNYDPYRLLVPAVLYQPPDGLAWASPTGMSVVAEDASSMTFALTYPSGGTASLVFTASSRGTFDATFTPNEGGPPVAYFRLRPRGSATEGFYGLGETFGAVNQRGSKRAMQLELDTSTESGYNNEHAPIPFILGTSGWGLFVESAYPGAFAVATESDDLVEATFGTGLASTAGLTFHVFGEPSPIDLTRHYYEATGFPRLPARWALGPWIWRHVASQAEAAMDLSTIRSLDLATSGFWFDDGYFTAVQTFDWNQANYTNPQALLDQAHGMGFGLALWHAPYLDAKSPATASLRAVATNDGYYPPVAGLPLNSFGTLLDLTNPGAFAWWQGLVETYTSMGIEGFKLDYAEDVVPGLTSGRNVWEFADGSDERTMHGRYQLFYHSLYAETLPGEGGFLLCRHATFGDQKNLSVMWPGDLDSTFAKNGDQASTYVSVGGFPSSVAAGLALGPSGFPFFGADTGGYLHQPPDKELMTRWFEQTALSTVMQIYADTRPWVADAATGYDDEMLGWLRTYMRLHMRLFPYVWTYAENLAVDGRPIARALGLAHPELGVHPSDTYLFGDALLVAPVIEAGATSRDVVLPAGSWIDWWTGDVLQGTGASVTVDAPLGTLPLFLHAGSIVPMLRPTIATLYSTTTPDTVDSYATTAGVLWARVAPFGQSSFTVFDGTTLTEDATGDTVALTASQGSEFQHGVMFEVIATRAAPSSVTDNGTALAHASSLGALEAAASGWTFTSDTGGTVWVKTGAGSHAVVLVP
jgi:alpha-D-xyloside xylohydrolase